MVTKSGSTGSDTLKGTTGNDVLTDIYGELATPILA